MFTPVSIPTIDQTEITVMDSNEVKTLSPFAVELLKKFDIPTPVHIICICLIMFFSICGNTLVLYVYLRKKPFNVGNMFIITLAVLDIYAAIVIPPQFAMIHYFIERALYQDFWRRKMVLYFLLTVLFLYLEILVSIALDRVWAVFAPYSYTQSKKRITGIILLEIIISVILSVLLREINDVGYGKFNQASIGVFIIVCFSILVCSYIAIIYKLKKNKRKVDISGRVTVSKDNKRTRSTMLSATQFDRWVICIQNNFNILL